MAHGDNTNPQDSANMVQLYRLTGVSILIGLVFSVAWVHEDAFITFRVVDNLLAGYGPVFNLAERVQAFTHPLWFFLLAMLRLSNVPLFYVSIFLGLICTAAALMISHRTLRSRNDSGELFLFFCVALGSSLSFLDFSTSGLENSLTHLLLALLAWLVLAEEKPFAKRAFWVALCAALLGLNRLDTLLLAFPSFVYIGWQSFRENGARKTILMMGLGLVPLALWEVFSIVYYGTPFPNTYFAKMDGYGFFSGARQGIIYLADYAQYETLPFVLGIIAAGFVLRTRHVRSVLLVLGALLYVAYVVKIGGDYMRGRFFTAPYFLVLLSGCAAICHTRVCHTDRGARAVVVGAAVVAMLCFVQIGSPKAKEEFGKIKITRARDAFLRDLSLAKVYYDGIHTTWANEGRNYRVFAAQNGPVTFNRGAIGLVGYYAGPQVSLINGMGLIDPFMARLPALPNIRPGHVYVSMPAAYRKLRGVTSGAIIGKNAVASAKVKIARPNPDAVTEMAPGEQRLWKHVLLLTRAPLFSQERLKAILTDFFFLKDIKTEILAEALVPVETRAVTVRYDIEEFIVSSDGIRIKGWAETPDTTIVALYDGVKIFDSPDMDFRYGRTRFGLSSKRRVPRSDIAAKLGIDSDRLGFQFLLTRTRWMSSEKVTLSLGFQRTDHVEVFASFEDIEIPPSHF